MFPSKVSVLCDKVIEAGWLVAAISIPLFFSGYASSAADKPVVLQLIAATMLAAWLIKWIDQHGTSQTHNRLSLRVPLIVPTLFLLAVYLLATATSIAPHTSFFGAYQRPQGMYALIAYVIVFAMILQGLRTREQLDRLIVTIIITSFPIALYAILQNYNLDPLPWNLDFDGRSGAMLGNPIFLAAYLIMVFILTLSKVVNDVRLVMRARRDALPVAEIAELIACLVIATAQFVAIAHANSRGPQLGWFAGIVFFLLLYALIVRRRRLVLGALGVGAAGVLFLSLLNLPNSPLTHLRNVPVFARLADLRGATGEYRLFTWSNVARLIEPRQPIQFPDGTSDWLNALRPFVGYGPDTLSLVYNQVAPASSFTRGLGTDKSHNDTWDTWVTTGIVGVVASQLFYLCVFLYGLRWLGLLRSPRDHNLFIGLWVGLGIVGGGVALLAGQPGLIGLGIPGGNLVAIFAYLAWFAFQSNERAQEARLNRPDLILLAGLLAGVMAHYVELQFGIAVVATHTLLWIFAASMVALGSGRLECIATESDKAGTLRGATRPIWVHPAASHPILIAIILTTLLYEFITPAKNIAEPFVIIWRALSFNPMNGSPSYAILALLLATWLVTLTLVFSEMIRARGLVSEHRRTGLTMMVALSLLPALVFVIGLASQLAQLLNVPAPIARLTDLTTLAQQTTGLIHYYVLALGGLMLLTAITLMPRPVPARWLANRSRLVGLIPVVLAGWLALCIFNLKPLGAEAVYALGKVYDKQSEWNGAISLYKSAVRLAPLNDAYYMSLGRAFTEKSNKADSTGLALFDPQTSLQEILALDDARTAKLNRADLLFAGQAALKAARSLNPLYLDHTVNLARFYLPALPVDSLGKSQLVDLSNRYYAQAIRISPNDVLLWHEWADFDQTYRNDPEAAIHKLEEAFTRDPLFEQTYASLNKLYTAKQDYARVVELSRRLLAIQPKRTDAQSRLAFAYYQLGRFAEAIEAYSTYIEIAQNAPNLWEAHKNLALLYEMTGNLSAARQEAQLATQGAPAEYQSQLAELVVRLRTKTKSP